MRDIRRLDIVWTEKEVKEYDALCERAAILREAMPDYVKRALKRHLDSLRSP